MTGQDRARQGGTGGLWSVPDVARELGLSEAAIYKHVERRTIPNARLFWDPATITRWAATRPKRGRPRKTTAPQ